MPVTHVSAVLKGESQIKEVNADILQKGDRFFANHQLHTVGKDATYCNAPASPGYLIYDVNDVCWTPKEMDTGLEGHIMSFPYLCSYKNEKPVKGTCWANIQTGDIYNIDAPVNNVSAKAGQDSTQKEHLLIHQQKVPIMRAPNGAAYVDPVHFLSKP